MLRKLIGLSLTIVLTVAASLFAETPQINNVQPAGIRRGVESEITISGANLKGAARIESPLLATAKADNGDAANLKVKLVVPAETPLGFYPIRVRTDDGLSNPLLIAVGQVPEIVEVEENSTPEQAQAIALPCAVNGQAAGNDVDVFKFSGKKGERIVVEAQCAQLGSGLDPQLRLTTVARKLVASADDSQGLGIDARIIVDLPDDGDYLIELSDSKYQGANRPIYRLLVGAFPVADEVFPAGGRRGHVVQAQARGGSLREPLGFATQLNVPDGVETITPKGPAIAPPDASEGSKVDVALPSPLVVDDLPEAIDDGTAAIRLVPPIVINARIDKANATNRHALAVSPGQKLRIRLEASELGSALDAQLQVLGDKDAVLANADDSPLPAYPNVRKKAATKKADFVSPDPILEFTVPEKVTEIRLAVRDLEKRGGVGFAYRLTVAPSSPTYELWLDESEINLPKGGTTNVYVTAERVGYNGPIALAIHKLPAGVTARSQPIAAGQTVGLITLDAAADASFDVASLRVEGRGDGPDGPISRLARKAIIVAQANGVPTKVLHQGPLPLALAGPSPIVVRPSTETLELPIGTEASVPVKVTRGEGADAALAITALTALPKGVAQAESKVAEKANEGKAAFKADGDAPLGPHVVGLEAKGKVAGKDRSYDVPAITVNVVRPIGVELTPNVVEVKPGTTAEVRGKIVRKNGFAEPLTIKPDALPGGVTIAPITLDPAVVEFVLKITAAGDAPEARAEAKILPAYQVNKKDLPPIPVPLTIVVPKP